MYSPYAEAWVPVCMRGALSFSSYYVANWIGLSSVLPPRQHSIGYMGGGL